MAAYHQMGHDSSNLLGTVGGFAGAIVSPVNESKADVAAMIEEHQSDSFEFLFDPQLYYPQRADRGKLGTWKYFPKDIDTADISSLTWWKKVVKTLAQTAAEVGARAICSPGAIPQTYSDDYYMTMKSVAESLVTAAPSPLRVLQTVVVRLADLTEAKRPFEIASIVSGTSASGVYLVMVSDVKPRDEHRDVEQLKGAMRLINALETAGLKVLVGFTSSDLVLWKAAGATSCATGKFANLRRFTTSRFDEEKEGGRQMAYWLEEGLLAFLRQSDIVRVQKYGMAQAGGNPFGTQILEQLKSDPKKAWVALGWRQYMHWFADMESRLRAKSVVPRNLIKSAETTWATLEEKDVFMEEPRNDGTWLRPWLRATVEFTKQD